MKNIYKVLIIIFIIVITGLLIFFELRQKNLPPPEEKKEVKPGKHSETLISPGISHPKNAAEGLKKFTDQMDILTENGMNLFGFSANWKDLELSPYEFDLQANPINPLTLLIPKYPQVKGVVFVLKMIDTNWKPMPKDLETKSFDDPEVLRRFDALIDAIAVEPSTKRITHILLGNELDGYLGQHPEETEAFEVFYNRALLRIHQKLPGVKVGTIFTAGGILGNVNIANFFNKINRYSDFIDYTYYPVHELKRGNISVDWQMMPVSEIENNLTDLAKHAGNKPFAFTEIGYSSSPINNSSEEKQAKFVQEMFRILSPYQKKGQIDFILYSFMYDAPPNFTEPYAREQGFKASKEFHAFMDNIGLRSYETGKPRKAWKAFVEGVKEWDK